MTVPDEWKSTLQCPECDGHEVTETAYDDGPRFDVKLECQDCGERTWFTRAKG